MIRPIETRSYDPATGAHADGAAAAALS